MSEITKIRENLNVTANAVNGMMSATDDAERFAWVTIYNARMKVVFELLDDMDKPVEMGVPADEQPIADAPADVDVAPATEDVAPAIVADESAEQVEQVGNTSFNE